MSKVALEYESASRMSCADYRMWAEQRPAGRYERVHGVVVAMAPERIGHNRRKARAYRRKARAYEALRRTVQAAGLPCEVYTDGVTIEVGDSDYEPDAVVHCGARLPDEAIAVPDPMIIVEVLSPSTSASDRSWKLEEYFRLPSLRHCLIIWADKRQIAHHRRGNGGEVETQSVTSGEISLCPPGITITVDEVYAA